MGWVWRVQIPSEEVLGALGHNATIKCAYLIFHVVHLLSEDSGGPGVGAAECLRERAGCHGRRAAGVERRGALGTGSLALRYVCCRSMGQAVMVGCCKDDEMKEGHKSKRKDEDQGHFYTFRQCVWNVAAEVEHLGTLSVYLALGSPPTADEDMQCRAQHGW